MSIKLNEEQREILLQQWSDVVPEGQDYRPTFLGGFKKLTVEQVLMHINGDDGEMSDEQVANLAVIISGEVGANLTTGKLSAKPKSDGEVLLTTILGSKELEVVVPLLSAFLVGLHRYLHREAKQDRNVVRTLIFVPSNGN